MNPFQDPQKISGDRSFFSSTLIRYGSIMFLAYIGGSYFFLISLHSVFNGGFYFSIKWLCLPLAGLIFGVTFHGRQTFYEKMKSKGKVWFLASVLYLIALLMTWPYVMVINAATGHGQSITYEGPIIEKCHCQARTSNYQITIRDLSSHQDVTLLTSASTFATLKVGDTYRETFLLGGLGLPYRWHKWN